MNFDNLNINLTLISQYFNPKTYGIENFDYTALFAENFQFKKYFDFLINLFSSPIEFTVFQFNILKIFLVILFINILLIIYYWRKYGTVITDRFIRPSESFCSFNLICILIASF